MKPRYAEAICLTFGLAVFVCGIVLLWRVSKPLAFIAAGVSIAVLKARSR